MKQPQEFNAADASKYIQLLMEVWNLEQSIQHNPSKDPAQYVVQLQQVANLYNEIAALVKDGKVSAADIEAAHSRNQTVWTDPRLPLPPPDPVTGGAQYETPLTDVPTVPPFEVGDHLYEMNAPNAGKYWVESKEYGITGGNKKYLRDLS